MTEDLGGNSIEREAKPGEDGPEVKFVPRPLADKLHVVASSARNRAITYIEIYASETVRSFVNFPRNIKEIFSDRPRDFRYRALEAAAIGVFTAAAIMAKGVRLP